MSGSLLRDFLLPLGIMSCRRTLSDIFGAFLRRRLDGGWMFSSVSESSSVGPAEVEIVFSLRREERRSGPAAEPDDMVWVDIIAQR